MAAATSEEILIEDCGQARVVTLNRPKQLNALTHSMVEQLRQVYEQAECGNKISLLILKGFGQVFCAGFDVAEMTKAGNCSVFKEMAYTSGILNHIMGTYTKPHVALLDGIVMGGGAGISILGSIRVVTEKTVFSMPETALGFHPGTGASHFLSRLPGFLGEYVGLTGCQLNGAEMVACGLATHFVPSKISLASISKSPMVVA
ncbi:hypothetical protein L7F22_059853 [Adiantum nelumboides]|nr:hypothetical protein [Adiantum nelumboides]